MAECCCWCLGKPKDDQLLLGQRSRNDERCPVVTQPPRNYTKEDELKKLRDEKEYLNVQVQNLQSRLKEQEERYNSNIDIKDLEIRKLKLDVEKIESKNNELLTRLSAVASANLTDGNPNIADLSDVNRPTKLSEQFSELYDNEWTDAFDKLTKRAEGKRTDEDTCKLLLDVLTTIFDTCHSKAKDDLQTITTALTDFNGVDVQSKEVLKSLKDDRKKNFSSVIKTHAKEIQDSFKDIIKEEDAPLMSTFIEKCTSLCWSMAIQDPPVYVDVVTKLHASRFDKDKYKSYTQSGDIIDYVVWPVLYLHEGGNILSKGIAQGMKIEHTDTNVGIGHGMTMEYTETDDDNTRL